MEKLHTFRDADPFLFASGNSRDQFITDLCLQRVLNPEKLGHDTKKLGHICFTAFAFHAGFFARSSRLQGELQGAPHRESGVMQVIFGIVDDLAAEVSLHPFGVCTSIRHLSFDGLIAIPLIAKGFEKSGTAGTRSTEHQEHFARSDAAIEIADQLSHRRFSRSRWGAFHEDRHQLPWEREKYVADRRLQSGPKANPLHREMAEDNTTMPCLCLLAVLLAFFPKHSGHQAFDFIVLLLQLSFRLAGSVRPSLREDTEQALLGLDGAFGALKRHSLPTVIAALLFKF